MAEGDSISDVHDSDFESDFSPSQILKSVDVGIDQVTSIAFNIAKSNTKDMAFSRLAFPLALITTNNYPSQKVYCEKNGEELPYRINTPDANQLKGNYFSGTKENSETLEVVYTRPGDKYHIRIIQLTLSGTYINSIDTETARILNKNYTDLFVTGMCDATGGDVAACLVESHLYDVTSDSHRMVRLFDRKRFDIPGFLGALVSTNHPLSQPCRDIEFDGQERLFTYPKRIALSSRGDFWVVNRTGEQSGDVTVVGMADGKLKFRYNRRVGSIPFDPKDVARNIKETMVIADFRNHAVHLVKDDGTFLQYIMTSAHGLSFPTTVAIDRYERAWIGCDFGKVHIVRFNKGFEFE